LSEKRLCSAAVFVSLVSLFERATALVCEDDMIEWRKREGLRAMLPSLRRCKTSEIVATERIAAKRLAMPRTQPSRFDPEETVEACYMNVR